jgi:stearoyl-CoA desaturase (delta-9 desaturase)
MFFITGFYHRYFSHRTFKTSRPIQFLMGFLGATAGQRGPLWWAAHHRHHHGNSDGEEDYHSPRRRGFLWSHTLWFLSRRNFQTPANYIPDWLRYRELVWLDRLDWVPFLLFGVSVYWLGVGLETWVPQAGLDRAQVFVWGFLVSTVLLYHGTYTINSLSHQFGRRRFLTGDDSRNNWFLALLTLGEGWHNNHHYYPSAVRQGFFWWEIDVTYYFIRLFNALGIVWDLRPVPAKVLQESEPALMRPGTEPGR